LWDASKQQQRKNWSELLFTYQRVVEKVERERWEKKSDSGGKRAKTPGFSSGVQFSLPKLSLTVKRITQVRGVLKLLK